MRIIEDGLTFDDVLLIPGYSKILPHEANLSTRLTRGIELNIPLVSAAMDTVTESALAIALAQAGGLGVIHKNMSPLEQAAQVRAVKKFESGVIRDPIITTPNTSIKDVLDLTTSNGISGVPVVSEGKLVGIVTSRDLRFESRFDFPVSEIMTPKDKLVTVNENASKDAIIGLLHEHRIEKLLVVNDSFELRGLITVKDIQKSDEYPNACKDDDEQLRVGGAVGVGEAAYERVDLLIEAGVDVIVIDTAHGHSAGVIEAVRWLKKNYSNTQVIAGNVATGDGAIALAEAGVDGVKVGIGPGSICTTRIVTGIGVPQITAVANVTEALKKSNIPVISDGGIRYSGDIAKVLATGANSVMIGSLFAGTEEAPGEVELFQGRSYKSYRGMGSMGAMTQRYSSSDRYFQESSEIEKLVPEGIEGRVPYKGPMSAIIHQMLGGVRAAMGYTGCGDMSEFRTKPEFLRVTAAGMRESHAHDVQITKEAPNYRLD
ncbi:MAG: IMP dehydrogenase [Thiotrichales bacterium]|nr:IMP dehydrogenase [Thiotrichales bacterium]